MIFSSLFSHREKHSLWALIDIQSGLVRGSIVAFSPSSSSSQSSSTEHPRVIYTTTKPIPHKSDVTPDYITTATVSGVSEIAEILAKEGIEHAKQNGFSGHSGGLQGIHYILSSPWVISQTKTVVIDYDASTTITNSIVNTIMDAARAELEEKYRADSEAGEMKFDAAFIEQKIFEVKLNGYSVKEYAGKVAQHLEVSCAISVSSKSLLEKISLATRRSLHTKKELFHSALLLEYAGLRDVLHSYTEYIAIHVHSELTDVIVVKNNMCTFLASFPTGTSTLLRKISKGLNETEEVAASTLTLVGSGKMSGTSEAGVKSVIDPIGQEWTHELLTTLERHNEHIVIPRNIVLSAHSHFPFFQSILSAEPTYRFSITPLESSMVESLVAYDAGQDHSPRMGLYSLAVASFA